MAQSEFNLIDEIRSHVKSSQHSAILGIGDDTAVLPKDKDTYQLFTVDSQVENVHFRLDWASPEQIGQKAMAVNVSDIAAMGGKPTYCVISLVLPSRLPDNFVPRLYDGIQKASCLYEVDVVGGNISKGSALVIDIAMMGETPRSHLLTRSGAKPGDFVVVTDSLGEAAAGLALLQHPELHFPSQTKNRLLKHQLTPTARLNEAQKIVQMKIASSMIDISDGVSSDIFHICRESHVGVELWADRIPISKGVKDVAHALKIDPLELALDGGEDYELLFTIPTIELTPTSFPVSVIGQITKKKNYLILQNKKKIQLYPKGWDHFES